MKLNVPFVPTSFQLAVNGATQALIEMDTEKHFECCDKAAQASPELWLGMACKELENNDTHAAMLRFEEVIRAAEGKPVIRAMALNNIGTILTKRGEIERAEDFFERALALNPRSHEIRGNVGLMRLWQNRVSDAEHHLEAAVRLKPDFHEAHWSLSLCKLVRGDYLAGWTAYESRFANQACQCRKLSIGKDEWDGRRTDTLLLYTEQGIGDTIQFIRFASIARHRVGKLWIRTQPKTGELLRHSGLFDRVFEENDMLPTGQITHVFPLMSLPRLFQIHEHEFNGGQYIPRPEPMELPTTGKRLKIGLAWAGSAGHMQDRFRSTTFERLSAVMEGVNADWYSLQVGPRSIDCWGSDVHDITPQLTDFYETARAIAQLDAVVAVDTSTVHLAGALGVKTLALLAFCPDWRWKLGTETTAWYRSVRLLRKPSLHDWDTPIAEANSILRTL